jgi:hypothetical protein
MPTLSPLVIVNRACAKIGVPPLQSLDEESQGGQAAQLIYDTLLDLCTGIYPWTFLRDTQELARTTAAQAPNGFRYTFQLPANQSALPTRIMASRDVKDVITDFAYEGNKLYCDFEQVFAELRLDPVPEIWSGPFRSAFITALASQLAEPLASDGKLSAALHEQAFGPMSYGYRGGELGAAIQVDARNAPVRSFPSQTNPLLQAWHS